MLFFGILSILGTMAIVMGSPFIYYLKRDHRWEATDRSIAAWYE